MSRTGQVTLNFDKRFRAILKTRFGTDDNEKIKQICLDYLKNGDTAEFLSAKERKEEALAQIAEAKATRVIDKESLGLRKLEAETELVERQLTFDNTFGSPASKQAKIAMRKGINGKYYGDSPNVSETIQPKKNFFIEKQEFGYVGKCRTCLNFETNLCSTGYEAEGDIELHLESVHQKELYVR